MRTIAFVGPSGSGKSYRAVMVSKKYGADAIIDDGLLISQNKVLAGTSAKREQTGLASVRRALFFDAAHTKDVRDALLRHSIQCVMILGTSDAMAERIAKTLELPEIEQFIHIEDVASPEEIEHAQSMRKDQGKHVIPIPTFEIKKDFSGYFLHPLRIFRKRMDGTDAEVDDKTIVRPTYSYLGDYTISDQVLEQMASYEAQKVPGVCKIHDVRIRKTAHGAHIELSVTLQYGCPLVEVSKQIQNIVATNVERYSAVNVRRVHVLVKTLNV